MKKIVFCAIFVLGCLTKTTLVAAELPPAIPGCPPPNCQFEDQQTILHPHADQTLFYQCAPGIGGHQAVEMSCPGGLWFGYEEQTCLFPVNWTGMCGEYVPSTIAPELCGEPRCETEEQILTLHPDIDPSFFYQCTYVHGEVYVPRRMPCAPGTLFGFEQQTCVFEHEWKDACTDDTNSSPVTPPGTTAQPPTNACSAPLCDTQTEIETLHPDVNPQNYFECVISSATGLYEPVLQICPQGLFFGVAQNACVAPCYWQDMCTPIGTQTPPPVTTEIPTTEVPTTEIPTTEQTTIMTTTETAPIVGCLPPTCDDPYEIARRHPSHNAQQYYQCVLNVISNTYEAKLFTCPPGLFFGATNNQCVAPCYWVDVCINGSTPNPTGTTGYPTTEYPTTEYPTTGYPSTGNPTTTDPNPTGTTPNFTETTAYPTETTTIPIVTPTMTWSSTSNPNTTTGTTRTTPTPTPSPSTAPPPSGTCPEPACYFPEDIAILHPSENPQEFYECVSTGDGWHSAVLRSCDSGYLFGFKDQTCVEPCYWEDMCKETLNNTTPVAPTPTTDSSGGSCQTPSCDGSGESLTRLYPAENPVNFYQCIPNGNGGHLAVKLTCQSGLYFGDREQVCVWPADWVDVCDGETTATSPVTPPGTTEPATTEEPTSGPITLPPTTGSCQTPSCDGSGESLTRLYPAENPVNFYQCIPNGNGGHTAAKLTCQSGLYFGDREQVCVWPADWVDVCDGETTATSPVTPPGTTEPATTEEPTPGPTSLPPTTGSCQTPSCDGSGESLTRLYPAENPVNFYQCVPNGNGGHMAVKLICHFGLFFGDKEQVCVWPADWVDVCDGETTATSPVTPPGTTEPATTEEPTSSPTTLPPTIGSCESPSCDGSGESLTRLYPAENPANFYQCIPNGNGGHLAVKLTCQIGLLFSYNAQVCVWPADWVDVCDGETTATSPVTPPVTTEPATTEETTPAPTTLPPPACGDAPLCNIVNELVVLHPTLSPFTFYRCEAINGGFVAVLRDCLNGTRFDYQSQSCVWPQFWREACEGLTTETPIEITCGPPTCTDNENLLYPNVNPQLYYMCVPEGNSGKKPILRTCANGMFFGFQQQACVETCDWVDQCNSWGQQ